MEFGKIPDVEGVDWELPENDSTNIIRKRSNEPKMFVGTPAWGVKHWVGEIYPEHTPAEKFLYFYSRNFNCIELNTTHYRIPDLEKARGWVNQVPAHFRFCPKFPKEISHSRFGITDKYLIGSWLEFLSAIQEKLGSTFIQFHEKFSYEEKFFLFQFLESWPSEFKLSIEFRHPSWFVGHTIRPALSDYLRKRGIGLVITDVAGRRDVLHSTITAPWTMIRLVGNDLHPSDAERLKLWAQRLSQWQAQGVEETFLFLHQPEDKSTLEFAQIAHNVFEEEGFEDFPSIHKIKPWDLLSFESSL